MLPRPLASHCDPQRSPATTRWPRAALAVVVLALGAMTARAQGGAVPVTVAFATVETSQGPQALEMDLYLPATSAAPAPCVLWIHGGAWSHGSRFPTPAAFLANHGYVVVSIDYRLSDEAQWPAQLHDVKGAVRWLRANASAWGIDPDRIGVWGESAGAHLGLCLGTTGGLGLERVGQLAFDLEGSTGGNTEHSSRVQAVNSWYGVASFPTMSTFPTGGNHDGPGAPETAVLGTAVPAIPERSLSISPQHFLSEEDPPFHLQHGTLDYVVPYGQSEGFHREAVEVHGLRSTFIPVIGAGHVGPLFDPQSALPFFDGVLMAGAGARVSVSVPNATLVEGGAVSRVEVHRDQPAAQDLRVRLSWSAGSAAPGADTQPLPSEVLIPAGATGVTVDIAALEDGLIEGEEELRVTLVGSSSYRIAHEHAAAVLTIAEAGAPPDLPTVSVFAPVRTALEAGHPAVIRLHRTSTALHPFETPLSVQLRVGGTARPGLDHDLLSGEVVFPAGAATVDLLLNPVADGIFENTELWTVEVQPSGQHLRGAAFVASGRLIDAELWSTLPTVSITSNGSPLLEGQQGFFIVGRNGDLSAPLDVGLLVQGSPAASALFSPLPSMVTIPAGQRIVSVPWAALANGTPDREVSAVVHLVPPAGVLPTQADSVTLTRLDDDRPAFPQLDVALRVPALRLDATRPVTVGLRGTPGGVAYLAVSLAPEYVALASFPLLVDPSVALVVGPARPYGSRGASTLTFPLGDFPELASAPLWMQAFEFRPGGVGASSAVMRRLVR